MNTSPHPGAFAASDLSLLSDIVTASYADTLSTQTWSGIMGMIGRVIDYDAGGAVFANVQTGRLEEKIYCNTVPDFVRWYDEHYPGVMVIATAAQTRGLSVWRPAEVLGQEEWDASEIRKDLLRDFGFRGPVCMTCGQASELSARFWFIRKADRPDFSARDIYILRLLQPHFSNTLRIAKTTLQGEIYRAAWHQTTMPRFLLSASGDIMEMNPSGTMLADEGSEADHLAEIESIARDMIAGHLRLRNAEFKGLKCRVWLYEVVLPSAPSTYVLSVDTARDVRNLMKQSALDAGCSEREADVCMMVAMGSSNREIASSLFIAESTVKDHLANIFTKLGVTHRSGIVPRLLGL